MAKIIFEKMLENNGELGKVSVDSAAYDEPPEPGADTGAREAIRQLYGSDLLGSHVSKRLSQDLVDWADLILVMSERMKANLPFEKTRTLKEYAGQSGNIVAPYKQPVGIYIECAEEIRWCLELSWPKLQAELDAGQDNC